MPKETDLQVTDIEFASWSPGADGEGIPPTEVHVMLTIQNPEGVLLLRLKSRRAVDELISSLVEHRDYVFGGVMH